MKEASVEKDKVLTLSRRYGELDGEISYLYDMAFTGVAKTLTADQKKTLLKLRNLDAKYTCKGAYLYSSAIAMPEIPNTDFLFGTQSQSRQAASTAINKTFVLRSPEVAYGGQLPKDYTGDGTSSTLPLEWSGAPEGTKSYAVIMHHIPGPGDVKWYWILYNIPAGVKSLPKNVKGVGTLGNNSVNGRTKYTPPRSKGPGAKTYIYTVYALSAPVELDVKPSEVNRDVLLAAIKDKIIASAELQVIYSRDVSTDPSQNISDR